MATSKRTEVTYTIPKDEMFQLVLTKIQEDYPEDGVTLDDIEEVQPDPNDPGSYTAVVTKEVVG